MTEPLLLRMPREHPLTKKRRITLAEVSSERFILLSEMHCLGEQVTSFYRHNAFEPKVACRSAQLSPMLTLIAAGQGVSLIPQMARAADQSRRRVYREIADDQPSRTIVVVWHHGRHLTPAMREFILQIKRRTSA